MKHFICILIFLPIYLGYSQEQTGLHFENNLNWDEVKALAKSRNKFIFVDCDATWCLPCKKMNNDVYTKQNVASFYSDNFICVRVQMDSSIEDDQHTKKWYRDAHEIRELYTINAFPSFLFFSSDGNLVHRGVGYKDTAAFVTLGRNALDSSKQYYTLLKTYQDGYKDYPTIKYLSICTKQLGNNRLADSIAQDYIANYLERLSDAEFSKKENLDFISSFSRLVTSNGRFFNFVYNYGDKVDQIENWKGWSSNWIKYIITREEINSRLWRSDGSKIIVSQEPNWSRIRDAIRIKYNSYYADLTVLDSQIDWYEKRKDSLCVKYLVQKIDTYGLDILGLGADNLIVTIVVRYSNDSKVLGKAITWMEALIKKQEPDHQRCLYGNYAALLYKIGRREEGIDYMEKNLKCGGRIRKMPTLEKMKKGEKIDDTWDLTTFF